MGTRSYRTETIRAETRARHPKLACLPGMEVQQLPCYNHGTWMTQSAENSTEYQVPSTHGPYSYSAIHFSTVYYAESYSVNLVSPPALLAYWRLLTASGYPIVMACHVSTPKWQARSAEVVRTLLQHLCVLLNDSVLRSFSNLKNKRWTSGRSCHFCHFFLCSDACLAN